MRLSEYEKNWSKSDVVAMTFVTNKARIEGQLHKTNKVRVSDELSHSGDFIFLSAVKVYSLDDSSLLADADFLALNKSAIQFAFEKESSETHGKFITG